jgi:hypothetical protein
MLHKDNPGFAYIDPIGTLSEPDIFASNRYRSIFQSRQISPEKRLVLAILDDAVQSFIATMRPRNHKELREFEEAQTWIMETNSDWIFSFDSVCSELALDPDYLRSGLQRLKAEARSEHRPRRAKDNRLPRARTAVGRAVSRLRQPQNSRRFFSASHDLAK